MDNETEEYLEEVLDLIKEWMEYKRDMQEVDTLKRVSRDLSREGGEAKILENKEHATTCFEWAKTLKERAEGRDSSPPRTSSTNQILYKHDVREILRSLVHTANSNQNSS